MSRSTKTKQTIKDQVLKKVVKTPRDGNKIAELLGLPSYRSVSKVLGQAEKAGEIKKVAGGYVKA